MAFTAPPYCTRDQVARALDINTTARADAQVDRAIHATARHIERMLNRNAGLYPRQATVRFDWPNRSYARPWRLWLDQHTLISLDSLTSGGETIAVGDVFLEPNGTGPPFTHLELDLDTSAAFGQGGTHQRDIAVTGLFGWTDDQTPAGQLDGTIDSSTSQIDVTDGAAVGVGQLLTAGDERLLVTGRSMIDTGQDLQSGLNAAKSDDTVQVADGNDWHDDELLLVGSERMRVHDIAGNQLTVQRAVDGTTLASHSSGDDIYASRRLTVQRAAVGTTANTHSDGTSLTRWTPPAPVESLNVAEAIAQLEQERSGYGRTVGAGESQREARGVGLKDARDQVFADYARRARKAAI